MFGASKTASVSTGGTPDPQFNYVTMLLHGDGTNGAQNNTFLDSSSNAFTITRSGTPTQGTFSPYGSLWSNYFDGSSYLTGGTSISIGTGNFTLECWVYFSATNEAAPICLGDAGSGGVEILYFSGAFQVYISGSNVINVASKFSQNTWYHVAVVRNGTTVTAYLNGTSIGTATNSTGISGQPTIGAEKYSGVYYKMTGSVSNARITNTAVYTTGFTPSTAPLTAISGTQFLTSQSNRFIDNSSNAYTVTPTGAPSVQRFNPFGASTAYSTSVIGGSGYFDGTGDYLTIADNAALEFGSGNFTIEGWMYTTATGIHTLCSKAGSADNSEYEIYLYNGTVQAYISNGSSWQVTMATSAVIRVNEWNHIAVTRNGSSWNIWVNGVSQASATASFTINDSSTALGIGAFPDSGFPTTGYMCDFRMVKGTAVYTSTFTPPTAPITAVSGTSVLCSMTNAAIYDNAEMNDLETVGNAQISTSVKKYGTGSLSFSGGSDCAYSVLPVSNALNLGDFTIECWVYCTANANQGVFQVGGPWNTGGKGPVFLAMYPNGKFQWGYGINSSWYENNIGTFSLNTWIHVAIVRASGNLNFYVNGVQTGSTFSGAMDLTETTVAVGSYYTLTYSFNGYVDDFRITKGYARYTSTFTPPTAAFPNIGPT